jgi:hypothetical protein
LPSTRHEPSPAILKQLKQLFALLYELGTFGGGRHEEVLLRLRLEAAAAGWSSLAKSSDRDASARAPWRIVATIARTARQALPALEGRPFRLEGIGQRQSDCLARPLNLQILRPWRFI